MNELTDPRKWHVFLKAGLAVCAEDGVTVNAGKQCSSVTELFESTGYSMVTNQHFECHDSAEG